MSKMILLPYDRYQRLNNQAVSSPQVVCQEDNQLTSREVTEDSKSLENTEGTDCNTCVSHDRLSQDVIYTFIPPKMKSRASTLLGSLDSVLNWNKKGEIMYDNQTIELSHIADLLKI